MLKLNCILKIFCMVVQIHWRNISSQKSSENPMFRIVKFFAPSSYLQLLNHEKHLIQSQMWVWWPTSILNFMSLVSISYSFHIATKLKPITYRIFYTHASLTKPNVYHGSFPYINPAAIYRSLKPKKTRSTTIIVIENYVFGVCSNCCCCWFDKNLLQTDVLNS